jgi:hypothetical protein
MEKYNKRTWLNKENSPSLGNVVAFDGEVDYSNGSERTTFLSISDCRFTIKLIKNTEPIEDFISKMELLNTEIQLFINHLKGKTMKITEFKKGDLITRVKVSDEYTSEPKYEFDPFLFSEISNGKIWLVHFNEHKDYTPEIFSEEFEKRKDDEWEYYTIPDILRDFLLNKMNESKILLCILLRKYLLENNASSYHSK